MKGSVAAILLSLSLLLCGFTNDRNPVINIDEPVDAVVHESIVSVNTPEDEESQLDFPTYEELWTLDLTVPSGLTEEQLEAGLLKKLKPYAYKYIEMEEKYGINAVFLASKDGLESGWGEHAGNNNLSGWGYVPFDSPEECIEHVSLYIHLWYLTEPHDEKECTDECEEYRNQYDICTIGQYYRGTTVPAVNKCYNGRAFWETEVIGIMAQVYERIKDDELDIS